MVSQLGQREETGACLLIGAVDRLARFARIKKVRSRFTDQEFHALEDERERREPRAVMSVPTPDLFSPGAMTRRALVRGIVDAFRDPYLKPIDKDPYCVMLLSRLARFNRAESRKKKLDLLYSVEVNGSFLHTRVGREIIKAYRRHTFILF